MSDQDAVTELRSKVKPYQGLIHQGTYSNTIIRFEMGRLKPATLIKFLTTLGYIKKDGKWISPFKD